MSGAADPTALRRRRGSLPSRLVLVIGLAFVAVELTVLAVFTGLYWSRLVEDRAERVAQYAGRLHEPLRAALLRADEPAIDEEARLDAALAGRGGGAPSGPGRLPIVPLPGPDERVFVFAATGVHELTRTGALQLTDPAQFGPQGKPDEVRAFLDGDQLAPRGTVHRHRVVHVQPLASGGHPGAGLRGGGPEAVLFVQASLREVQRQVAFHGLVAFGTAALALLVTAMVTMAYLRRALLLPLASLIRADNAAREGDAAHAVVDEGDIPDDELGAIMRSRNHLFRAMTRAQRDLDGKNAELERQREELRVWGRELERLVQDKSAALLRARDTLYRNEKLAAVGRLAANVAHEINNPLASIAGYAEEARDELDGAAGMEGVATSLRTIEEQAFRCKDILKRLLGLARVDPVTVAPVALGRLLRETVALAQRGARKRGVTLRLTHGLGDGPEVPSDAGSLQQAALNLIENAADAAVQGDEPPWVEVGLEERPDEVALVVSDSGRGIPEHVRRRVFDPFYTTKPVGRGTGLGLAISHSLIERLGGRIAVEDAPGGGATFLVWLPRHVDAAPGSQPSAAAGAPRRDGGRVAATARDVADRSDLIEAHLRARAPGASPPAAPAASAAAPAPGDLLAGARFTDELP